MSFEKQQLQPGETIVVAARPHWITLIVPIMALLLSVIASIVLYRRLQETAWFALILPGLLWFIWRWLRWISTEYIVTNHRVVRQEGVLSKSSVDAPLDKINNIFHKQTVLQRILGNGEVGLETASETGMLEFCDVPRPLAFKNAIVQYREAYKALRGS